MYTFEREYSKFLQVNEEKIKSCREPWTS